MELGAGHQVCWTRNDPGSTLFSGQTAEVESVGKNGMQFRLEDGSVLHLDGSCPQIRHLNRAWASAVHIF